MQKVTDAVASYSGSRAILPGDFLSAAREWAYFALGNFVGERLTRALEVSRALAEYQAMDEDPAARAGKE